ncbi:MAG TPA: ornithine cyclodeaminase family protein [Chloroflexota bacterium]|nr:ornithine cyclodeaminase family protein [Chloroflexota bacterium]
MLFLNNDDVQRVLTVEDTLRVLEDGHRELARHELVARPRVDIYTETDDPARFHRWGTMEGSSKGLHRHVIRMKSDIISWRDIGDGRRVEDKYCTQPGLFCGLLFLFDTNTGEPLAIINDGYLQHLRVGGLAALGAKYLAKSDASVVGMLGSGGMAHSHLLAFAAVRSIKRVQVYSPTAAHREAYAREMSEALDLDVIPCGSAEEAARGAEILASCTSSVTPTVLASMVEPGMHLTQVMGEIHRDALARIDVAIGGDPTSQVVQGVPIDDSRGFTTYLAGSRVALEEAMGPGSRRDDLTSGGESRRERTASQRARVVPLVDLIAGTASGRQSAREVSASGGVIGGGGGKQGLQFVTVSSLVYDRAKAAGLGREVPTEWFLQDIRN